jgi:hypothetical protein
MSDPNPYAAPAVAMPNVDIPVGDSAAALRAIGLAQRRLMLAILVSFAVIGPVMIAFFSLLSSKEGEVGLLLTPAILVGGWSIRLVYGYLCFKLAEALGSVGAGRWVWGAVGALFTIITGAVLSVRASRRLKAAGIRVGLLGPKVADLPPEDWSAEPARS